MVPATVKEKAAKPRKKPGCCLAPGAEDAWKDAWEQRWQAAEEAPWEAEAEAPCCQADTVEGGTAPHPGNVATWGEGRCRSPPS